jgi:hypothetical protein
MTTDKPAAHIPPAFPKLIPLPAITRPCQLPAATPTQVKSAADLPPRLLLGDLVADSFAADAKGWSAEWRDADGPGLRIKCAGGLLGVEQQFAGLSGLSLVGAERFADLLHLLRQTYPKEWWDKLAEDLQGRFNLRVFPPREDDPVGASFPDGYLLSLVMPVAADRLPDLFALHKTLASDAALRTDIQAYLRLGFSVVNYLEGRNPPILSHPVGLVLQHVNALGTPAAEMPLREVDENGQAAWTLRRGHYVYVAHCHLREAGRLVARLADAGFIGRAGGGEGYPQGAEFAAALLPFGYEYTARDAWWFDAARSRRLFYPRFAEAEERNALGAGAGDLWIKALCRDAARAAEQTRAETLRAFAEGAVEGGDQGSGAREQ